VEAYLHTLLTLTLIDVRFESHVSATPPLGKDPPHLPIPAEYRVGKPQACLRYFDSAGAAHSLVTIPTELS